LVEVPFVSFASSWKVFIIAMKFSKNKRLFCAAIGFLLQRLA
jgi:hypothetical protein